MNTPISIEEINAQVYAARLVVNRLRREVYQLDDPAAAIERQEELYAAETALNEAEAAQAGVTAQDKTSGQLLDTSKGKPKTLGTDTTGLEVQVFLRMEQIPTSIYHLFQKEQNPLLTVQVKNSPSANPTASPQAKPNPIKRVRVTSYVDGFSVPAVNTLELNPKQTYPFDQLPALIPERIKNLTELTRASLNVLVEDLDTQKVEIHNTYPVWLLARTSATLAVRDPKTGLYQDFTPYLGAFVTPNAPSLMTFLRTAADLHPSKTLAGYQKDLSWVEPQVKALFDALKSSAGITYVNSVVDFTPDLGQTTQRVRLPRESLADRQANCIDGTVLFASLLEAISMSPAIVLVPGHAFLAYEIWSGAPNEWCYLETTMIGSHTFEEARAYAEKNAQKWMAQKDATQNPKAFRLLPLRDLRAKSLIFPME